MLKIRNLNYFYSNRQVLKEINLTVDSGEFIGIIGPNGAGKSTLLKLINGLLFVRDESVYINSVDINKYARKKLATLVAYVPQETEFTFAYDVTEVVHMGRFPHNKGFTYYSSIDEKIVKREMIRMEVEHFRHRYFNELSGGEKQRVVIASALAQEPQILLLDEPTSALDLHHQIAIYKILKSLNKEQKITCIIVTHDINLAAQYCQRIIILKDGGILEDGLPSEVLKFTLLQETFGVKVYIDINPMTKSLYILPYD